MLRIRQRYALLSLLCLYDVLPVFLSSERSLRKYSHLPCHRSSIPIKLSLSVRVIVRHMSRSSLEPAPYRTLVYPVLLCQLGYGLLAFNIFRLKTLIIKTSTTDELLATTTAFVKLAWAFAPVFLDIRGLAIIADFCSFRFKWCKNNKYQIVTICPSLLFVY